MGDGTTKPVRGGTRRAAPVTKGVCNNVYGVCYGAMRYNVAYGVRGLWRVRSAKWPAPPRCMAMASREEVHTQRRAPVPFYRLTQLPAVAWQRRLARAGRKRGALRETPRPPRWPPAATAWRRSWGYSKKQRRPRAPARAPPAIVVQPRFGRPAVGRWPAWRTMRGRTRAPNRTCLRCGGRCPRPEGRGRGMVEDGVDGADSDGGERAG